MPTAHVKQWKHNRRFFSLIDPEYPDWAVTVAFYTALHAIDALLAHDKVTVVEHRTRNQTLMVTNRYSKLWKHYLPLFDLSRTVRYMGDPAAWVPWDQIDDNVIRRYLYPIEDSVQKLMGISQDLGVLALKSAKAGPT